MRGTSRAVGWTTALLVAAVVAAAGTATAHVGSAAADGPTAVADAPARVPVAGPVERGFDPPPHPYGPGHRGVALRAAPDTPVRAALRGRVTFSGTVARVGWVTVDHGGGLVTSYGPLEPRRVVRGASVATGDVLGRVAPDAPRLHWGARLHGDYIDPLLLLGPWEVHLTAVDVPP